MCRKAVAVVLICAILCPGCSSSRPCSNTEKKIKKFSPSLVVPERRDGAAGGVDASLPADVREVVPGVFMFPLLTRETCAAIVRTMESCGRWVTKGEDFVEVHEIGGAGLPRLEDAETTQDLEEVRGLDDVYHEIARRYVAPLMRRIWPSFKIASYDDPYVLKYAMSGLTGMKLHYDAETVAMIVYLNDEFVGGGTYFQRWNVSTAEFGADIGTAVLYPGGISHVHSGLPISSGKRFLLLGAFF